MDVQFHLHGIAFSWNSQKARSNAVKHDGITFEQAAEAFFDPFLRVVDAPDGSEARDAVIGRGRDAKLLFVVHLQFDDDNIRIISARRATRSERSYYED